MHAVVDVVLLRELVGKLELNRLHALALARGAALAVSPILPADVLHVRTHLNGTLAGGILDGDLDGLDALALARGAGGGTIGHGLLPADILHMRLILDHGHRIALSVDLALGIFPIGFGIVIERGALIDVRIGVLLGSLVLGYHRIALRCRGVGTRVVARIGTGGLTIRRARLRTGTRLKRIGGALRRSAVGSGAARRAGIDSCGTGIGGAPSRGRRPLSRRYGILSRKCRLVLNPRCVYNYGHRQLVEREHIRDRNGSNSARERMSLHYSVPRKMGGVNIASPPVVLCSKC